MNVHQRHMADWLRDGFVVHDECKLVDLGTQLWLKGPIHCQSNAAIEVKKRLRVLGGRGWARIVQTQWFKYNAWIKGGHTRSEAVPSLGYVIGELSLWCELNIDIHSVRMRASGPRCASR